MLATFGTGADARTTVVAAGARVLHVQENRSGTLGSSGRMVLTVGLGSGAEVLEVAHAAEVASLTIVRAGTGSGATTAEPTGPVAGSGPVSGSGPVATTPAGAGRTSGAGS